MPEHTDTAVSLTLDVPDISCGHCKSSIEGAVRSLDGVISAEVTIDRRTVGVVYDQTVLAAAAIIEAIEAQGYAVAG